MDRLHLERLLQSVADGNLTVEAALASLQKRLLAPERALELDFARPDLQRAWRQSFPEVVFAPGKSSEQIFQIALELRQAHDVVLASRAEAEQARSVLLLAQEQGLSDVKYHQSAAVISFGVFPQVERGSEDAAEVAVLTGGTVDIPVAEEALVVLESAGISCRRYFDMGVAGLHRLLGVLDSVRKSRVVLVVAGMDGALPSVVCGLVGVPVIAVPTAAGYGTGLGGLAALASMLNTCAPGLTVVNIDNGLGAAAFAIRVLRGAPEPA